MTFFCGQQSWATKNELDKISATSPNTLTGERLAGIWPANPSQQSVPLWRKLKRRDRTIKKKKEVKLMKYMGVDKKDPGRRVRALHGSRHESTYTTRSQCGGGCILPLNPRGIFPTHEI